MFSPATSDLLGVLQTDNTLTYVWDGPGRIIASFLAQGDALSAHFASNKSGVRNIKTAINDFCVWAFERYKWCTMILAITEKPSVSRIVEKCGFFQVAQCDNTAVFARVR
jgi:YD repeat-containing protein